MLLCSLLWAGSDSLTLTHLVVILWLLWTNRNAIFHPLLCLGLELGTNSQMEGFGDQPKCDSPL